MTESTKTTTYFTQDFSKNHFASTSNIINETDLFSVSSYILCIVEIIRKLMNKKEFFSIDELKDDFGNSLNKEKLLNFSFNYTKLQKVILIAFLEYMSEIVFSSQYVNDNQLLNEINENILKNIAKNPIKDLNYVIDRPCGFLIDYDFFKFGIFRQYNKDINGDTSKSLTKYINNPYTSKDIKNILMNENNYSSFDRIAFSTIPIRFKEIIIDVLLQFVLFSPSKIGTLLNYIKRDKFNKLSDEEKQKIDINIVLLDCLSFIREYSSDVNKSFILLIKQVQGKENE
ncbi:MAG: hypothetical protein IJS03_02675 [Eubacterium sp.]|nr:hypothetical protein [Eubacterium sp.]